jgi:hypothetical protein
MRTDSGDICFFLATCSSILIQMIFMREDEGKDCALEYQVVALGDVDDDILSHLLKDNFPKVSKVGVRRGGVKLFFTVKAKLSIV